MFKTMRLCQACRDSLETAYKVTEVKCTDDETIKTQNCEFCGNKAIVALCAVTNKRKVRNGL